MIEEKIRCIDWEGAGLGRSWSRTHGWKRSGTISARHQEVDNASRNRQKCSLSAQRSQSAWHHLSLPPSSINLLCTTITTVRFLDIPLSISKTCPHSVKPANNPHHKSIETKPHRRRRAQSKSSPPAFPTHPPASHTIHNGNNSFAKSLS